MRAYRMRLAVVATVAAAIACLVVPPPPAGAAPRGPDVVLVTQDCAGLDFICPAFMRAVRATGTRGRVVSPDSFREDPVGTLSLLAGQGHDLVIVDFTWWEPLGAVALRFPSQRFALFDAPLSIVAGRPRNVAALVLEPREAAYLAGWLAARMERADPGPDVVGVVGGASIPGVTTFVRGFAAGARRAAPEATVIISYSDDFTDATKCEALARRQIARGAGVIFNVAGACGLGALRAAGRAGVWGIGVDTDQSHLGPHILTSVLKRYDAGFLRLLTATRRGSLRTGRTDVLGMRRGGAGLGRVSPRVPATIRAELAGVRREVMRQGIPAGPS